MATKEARKSPAPSVRQERLSRLGLWKEPLGYVNGPDMYQFVEDNPINREDPTGLKYTQFQHDIQLAQQQLAAWKAAGFSFAVDLLTAFLNKSYPSGNAGLAFNGYAGEIQASKEFRDAAQAYFSLLASSKTRGTYNLPDTDKYPGVFSVSYTGNNDLAKALGGAHFGYKHLTMEIGSSNCWKVTGTFVQMDNYDWDLGFWGLRRFDATYYALHDLQETKSYPAFSHREEWDDSFSVRAYTLSERNN